MVNILTGPTEASAHAVKMDRMYRTQRHIYDFTRKYYLLGRDQAIAGLRPNPGQTVLELGCGTGRNLALVAKRFPEARLYGLDISQEMLTQTRKTFANKGFTLPTLVAGDATSFTPEQFKLSGFDRILISYSLSMIPDWRQAIEAAISALSPNGSLHIVDFGQQEGLPKWFGSMLKAWLARFHVIPRGDLKPVLETIAARHGLPLQFDTIRGGYAYLAVISSGTSENA